MNELNSPPCSRTAARVSRSARYVNSPFPTLPRVKQKVPFYRRLKFVPQQTKQALADADVVKLRPDWEKSHFRRGMALEANGEDNDAIAAFEAALRRPPAPATPRSPAYQAPQGQDPTLQHPRPQRKVPTKSDASSTSTGPGAI